MKDKMDMHIKHTKIKGSDMNTCFSNNFTTEMPVNVVMYAKVDNLCSSNQLI